MNKEIYYGIPTYKRVNEQITLKFLNKMKIDKKHIILSTQNKEEYIKCSEMYSDICTVIYGEKSNLSGNRNNIIDFLPNDSNVLILDDDINSFKKNKNGKLEDLTREQFIEMVEKMFLLTRKYGGKLWSVYPVANTYFMEKEPVVKFNRPIICVHGVITTKDLRYNENQTVKEDYMFVCDNLICNYPTLRLENVTTDAKHFTNNGGCKEQWVENDKCFKTLLSKYSDYVIANKKRPGEILLKNNIKVGPVKYGIKKVRLGNE